MVTPSSGKKVWWICTNGHEWQATIASRTNGTGCPICSSERNTSFPEYAIVYYLKKHGLDVIHSYTEMGYELDVFIPSLRIAIEYDGFYWHTNKVNQDLAKNAKCTKDGIKLYRIREGLPPLNDSSIDYVIHKSQRDLPQILAAVLTQITGFNVNIDLDRDNIEIESLREFTEKENSLLSINPGIAAEWNYRKNGNLRPENFSTSSNKKVWWKCSKGHEWQAKINSRNNGSGCPYCSGRYAIKGESDLQTVNPSLAKEWDYKKNDGLTPADVLPNSNKKIWWRCSQGHEYQATVCNRNFGYGCPYCSGRSVLKGENDLQTVNPALAEEWDYEKNSGLTPTDVLPNSNKKVWWICSQGHEWQAMVISRNKGHGCPYCAGRYPIKGKSDLQTINPTLAKEWNYEKNNDLTPADVTPNSGQKVWWKCSKGHEWLARIADRSRGRGCPQCARRKR